MFIGNNQVLQGNIATVSRYIDNSRAKLVTSKSITFFGIERKTSLTSSESIKANTIKIITQTLIALAKKVLMITLIANELSKTHRNKYRVFITSQVLMIMSMLAGLGKLEVKLVVLEPKEEDV